MTVLVTRPHPDGEQLCQLLNVAGINAFHYPLLSFARGRDFTHVSNDIEQSDIIIAVSQHAVNATIASLQQNQRPFPAAKQYIAIGARTAQKLQQACLQPVIYPDTSESEHLVALPALQSIKNQRILILRGNGGRELIYSELKLRGARVKYNEVYQRVLLPIEPQSIIHWQQQKVQQLVVSSGEQLDWLYQQTATQYHPWLTQLKLYIPSQRIEQQAKELGFLHTINTGSAANAILAHYISTKRDTGNTHDR